MDGGKVDWTYFHKTIDNSVILINLFICTKMRNTYMDGSQINRLHALDSRHHMT